MTESLGPAGAPKPMDAAIGRLMTDPRLMVYVALVQQSAKQVPPFPAKAEAVKVTHEIQKQSKDRQLGAVEASRTS